MDLHLWQKIKVFQSLSNKLLRDKFNKFIPIKIMQLSEILENLKQPIPSNLISKKGTFKNKVKTGEVDYVSWIDLAELLDNRCGLSGWEWSISNVQQVGQNLTLTGTLIIHGDDRTLTKMATGIEELNCSSYGDPSSNAEAMALRRCCAKFGLGREMWRKGESKSNNSTPKPKGKGELTREQWLKLRECQQVAN